MWALLGMYGCSWWAGDDSLREELDAAKREITALRADLEALSEAPRGGVVEVATPRPPPRVRRIASHELARRRDVEAAEDLAGAVDEALGVLEADVDDQARALQALETSMRDLGDIVNNHADLLDQLGGEIEVLDGQLGLLRALDGTLEVEGGQVRIVDADLILVPGRDEDGRIKPNGQIRTADPE